MEPSDKQPSDQRPSDQRPASGQRPADEQRPAAEATPELANPPRPREKIRIMDLARYRVGQRAYWIVFRAERFPDFARAEPWMNEEHPMVLWQHKVLPWGVPMKPPRTHPVDTRAIMMLCSQSPKIEPFRIAEVERSINSGMFLYAGPKGIVMPEGMLFPTKKAARREISRIAKMFAAWTATWEEATEDTPGKQ